MLRQLSRHLLTVYAYLYLFLKLNLFQTQHDQYLHYQDMKEKRYELLVTQCSIPTEFISKFSLPNFAPHRTESFTVGRSHIFTLSL
jgi:hypothetical protein